MPSPPLHPTDFRILLTLFRDPLHGYAILKALEADPDEPAIPHPANLYRRLRDLRDRDWLEEAPPPESAPEDDRRRHYFTLTARGRAVATEEARRLERLAGLAARCLEEGT